MNKCKRELCGCIRMSVVLMCNSVRVGRCVCVCVFDGMRVCVCVCACVSEEVLRRSRW